MFTDSIGNINKKQQIKIKKSKKIVKKQRELIKKRTVKQTAKKTAAAAIPFAGAVIVAGIGANEYCHQLDDNIALSNTLNDTNEKFNYDVCFNEVKKDMGNLWQSFKNLF
ncbi:hypothetical protein SPBRAN_1762 [uncultured Candidatus Thioglobus sp.]|nr:hypothetical protein SPBRAN_1762 [uncultured Candidatus Thioglobus sp.]